MEAASLSNDTFEPVLSITINPKPLNRDSKSLHNILRGTGLEKMASRVFRCLLFMLESSTASTQVKNVSLCLANAMASAMSFSVMPKLCSLSRTVPAG